jgi:hypothetical protein
MKREKPFELVTVIADVSIDCIEMFHVKDKKTGEISIIGSTKPEKVTHLVRFEVEMSLGDKRWLGSWKIVDWNDALEGNVWYYEMSWGLTEGMSASSAASSHGSRALSRSLEEDEACPQECLC